MWLVGGLPGAGCGVCGGRPLLTVLLGRVVHSVTGQHGEDEVWRLGAEICLAFNRTGLSYLTKLLIIHTYSMESRAVVNAVVLDLGVETPKRSQDKPERSHKT